MISHIGKLFLRWVGNMRSIFWRHDKRIAQRLVSVFSRSSERGSDTRLSRCLHSVSSCLAMRRVHVGFVTATLVMALTSSLVAVLLSFGAVIFIARRFARQRELERWKKFDNDLPTLLMSVASSVRAGVDPLVALTAARQFFPKDSAMAVELIRCAQALEAGGDEYQAISAFARDAQASDVDLFRRCLALSRRHGSALAEPLHRITRVVRQRHSFRRKTRAALAMHRLSASGIAVCAGLIAALQIATNFDGVQRAAAHPVGQKLLLIGAGLIVMGVLWMSRMGKEERV